MSPDNEPDGPSVALFMFSKENFYTTHFTRALDNRQHFWVMLT